MFRSRAVQYLGLALLVCACLVVIFYPIGAPPQTQPYEIRLSAPRAFDAMARSVKPAGKTPTASTPTDIADAALLTTFTGGEKLPGSLSTQPNSASAVISDTASTREEAQSRATRVVQALAKSFPGVSLAAGAADAWRNFPVKPLLISPVGGFALYPYQARTATKLGLDLQGGVNLVLQVRRALFSYNFDKKLVDTDARDAFAAQIRDALRTAGQSLEDADVNIGESGNALEIRTQAKDKAQFDAQREAIAQALANVGGTKFTPQGEPKFYVPQAEAGQQNNAGSGGYDAALLDRTVEIVRARVDRLGVSEPQIQSQPPDRIIVQLPGISDPERAVKVVGTTAQMEIRLLAQGITPVPDPTDRNNTLFRDATGNILKASVVRGNDKYSTLIVPGSDVKPTTTAGFAEGNNPAIFFEMQGEGARRFGDVTRQIAGQGRSIPIFLDERCISAPTVQSPITGGQGQISGGFANIEEARELALLLNSGALPAPIDVVENRTISATLGADSLRQSLGAGLIGLALVAVFMIVFYRLPGVLANCALAVYCILNLAVFILVGGTLTLPGIAGFLLAIAMSLDTNILVFERLREEMAIQPTFSAALRAAFSRAWTAILDSHVTTLLASAVLFVLGTGPVKGFALTLGVGVLLSLFSAISVTRLFMWSVANAGERNRGLFGSAVNRSANASKTATSR
jgi:protein-export membrane protein SecD